MNNIAIGIVEDESIIADDLHALLSEIGYRCLEPCGNYREAIAMLHEENPDLVMLDINLHGKPDGIKVARYIRSKLNIPFIFLTANSDTDTLAMARETRPDAYMIKPFQKADLYTAIEVALYNFNYSKATPERKLLPYALFIKDGEYFHKVPFDEILYLSSEHVYVTVHTAQRKFLVRTSMQEYIGNFDPSIFFRVHRSYVINLKRIDKINSQNIIVNGAEIPISKQYREELLRVLNLG